MLKELQGKTPKKNHPAKPQDLKPVRMGVKMQKILPEILLNWKPPTRKKSKKEFDSGHITVPVFKSSVPAADRNGNLQYMVSCDWLQIHVKRADFCEMNTARFKAVRTGQTKVFKDVYSITDRYGNHIASYATSANGCILDEGHGILKFDNKQLYTKENLRVFVEAFLEEFNFRFIGITRLDICYDFHSFSYNRSPENFIKSFLKGEILKVKKTDFRVAGKHGMENTFNWLYFGSHNSDISCKLYNKTGEQKDAERKPWIWESWGKKSFLDTSRDIWRLEFTVNSNTAKYCNGLVDCEFHSLDILDHLHSLFSGLFNDYFRFVKSDKKKARKDRMKPVNLLEFPTSFIPFEIHRPVTDEKNSSTRTQKIFINQMLKHHAELRNVDSDFDLVGSELIQKVIDRYDLYDWAKQKNIPTYKMDFVYPLPIPGYKNYSNDIAAVRELIDDDVKDSLPRNEKMEFANEILKNRRNREYVSRYFTYNLPVVENINTGAFVPVQSKLQYE